MPEPSKVDRAGPTPGDFQHLLAFRVRLRQFQHWSKTQARTAGLTQVQHQLLVAIKGHPGGGPPTVSDLAAYLLLRHHSTVELVNRAEAGGLVSRIPDQGDARVVRVNLTGKGDRLVIQLTRSDLAELRKLAATMTELAPGGQVAGEHLASTAGPAVDRRTRSPAGAARPAEE